MAGASLVLAMAAAAHARPSLKSAFAAVYARPDQSLDWGGGRHEVRFSPFMIVALPHGVFALVSKGQDANGAHVSDGSWSVAYLRAQRGELARVGPILDGQASDGGFGRPPIIRLDRALERWPVLRITSTYQGTGEGDEVVDLVELGPTPRVVAQNIRTKFTDENGEHRGPYRCEIHGRIVPVRRDRSFQVIYRGDFRKRITWTRTGGEWRAAEPDLDVDKACPPWA